MGRNIPLSVSQAWFTALFYWTPLLGTLCSAVFLHIFVLQHTMCCTSSGRWLEARSEWCHVRAARPSQWRSFPQGRRRTSFIFSFFFQGGFEGELIWEPELGSDIWITAGTAVRRRNAQYMDICVQMWLCQTAVTWMTFTAAVHLL